MKDTKNQYVVHLSMGIALAAIALAMTTSIASAATQTDTLGFSSTGQNMWGPGTSFALDKTFDDLLFPFSSGGTQTIDATVAGSGLTLDYKYSGKAGLEARLRIDSGTVNASYPISLTASLPEEVMPGESFSIDTSNWSHLASSLSTAGPAARFTLDAILQLSASVGPGTISAVGFDLVDIPQVNLPGIDYTKTLIDIGSGASSVDFDLGDLATVTLAVPEQLETSSSTLIGSELKNIQSAATGDDKFLNLNIDIDAIAQKFFGLPDVLEFEKSFFGGDVSISATLLNVETDLGLKFTQRFTFDPTQIGVVMTSSDGQVKTGALGDSFSFTAPSHTGDFSVDAQFMLMADLRNETGFVASGSLTVQALELILHNEIGPDFDFNLAQSLFGRDFLVDETIPEGGLNSAPVFLFDSSFALGGFSKQNTQYSLAVVPEPSAFMLAALALVGLLIHPRRRRST